MHAWHLSIIIVYPYPVIMTYVVLYEAGKASPQRYMGPSAVAALLIPTELSRTKSY